MIHNISYNEKKAFNGRAKGMKSKLIKLLSLGIISFGLVGCNPAGGSTGRIDCYKIYEGGHTYQYHFVEKSVYEYTNEKEIMPKDNNLINLLFIPFALPLNAFFSL